MCSTQFALEKHLDILCSEYEIELEQIMELVRDELITSMLRIDQGNSLVPNNFKNGIEKLDLRMLKG